MKGSSVRRPVPQIQRIPVIDLLRGVSILAVVGLHFFLSRVSTHGYPPWLNRSFSLLFQNGSYGVPLFFTISGFVITRGLVGPREPFRPDLKAFYGRRVARILPLLALTAGVGAAIAYLDRPVDDRLSVCFLKDPAAGFGWGFWLSILTFTFNWFKVHFDPPQAACLHWGVLWSLAVEEQFYFFYPLLLRELRWRRWVLGFLGMTVLAGVAFRAWAFLRPVPDIGLIRFASFSAFDQIALGAMACLVAPGFQASLKGQAGKSWMVAGLGAFLLGWVYFGTDSNDMAQQVLSPTFLSLGAAMMILGAEGKEAFGNLLLRPLTHLGELSYGAYLWHTTVLFLLWPLLGSIAGPWAFLIFITGVWLWSLASYRWFEVPLNRVIRRAWNAR